MFTLSSNNGGVTFYPPSYHFPTPYQTRRHKDRAPMTTAATTRAPTAVSPTTGEQGIQFFVLIIQTLTFMFLRWFGVL